MGSSCIWFKARVLPEPGKICNLKPSEYLYSNWQATRQAKYCTCVDDYMCGTRVILTVFPTMLVGFFVLSITLQSRFFMDTGLACLNRAGHNYKDTHSYVPAQLGRFFVPVPVKHTLRARY